MPLGVGSWDKGMGWWMKGVEDLGLPLRMGQTERGVWSRLHVCYRAGDKTRRDWKWSRRGRRIFYLVPWPLWPVGFQGVPVEFGCQVKSLCLNINISEDDAQVVGGEQWYTIIVFPFGKFIILEISMKICKMRFYLINSIILLKQKY